MSTVRSMGMAAKWGKGKKEKRGKGRVHDRVTFSPFPLFPLSNEYRRWVFRTRLLFRRGERMHRINRVPYVAYASFALAMMVGGLSWIGAQAQDPPPPAP